MRARNFLHSSKYHFELTVSRKIAKMLTVSRKKSSPHLDPLPLKGKFSGLYPVWTHDLSDTGAALYQLS